jgi:internalin A
VLRPLSGRVHTLESLVTWNFDGSDFRPLNNYSRLKNLAVREAPRLQSLRGINVMNSLSALNLHLARQLSDISDLAESGSTLNKLSFDFCSRIGRLDALRSLRRLRLLGVSDCKRIESLAPLGQLTQLEVLHGWGSTRIVDGNLSLLLQLPRLREVRMKSRIEYRPSVDEITTAIRRGEPVDAAGKLSGQVHERLAHDEGISE